MAFTSSPFIGSEIGEKPSKMPVYTKLSASTSSAISIILSLFHAIMRSYNFSFYRFMYVPKGLKMTPDHTFSSIITSSLSES